MGTPVAFQWERLPGYRLQGESSWELLEEEEVEIREGVWWELRKTEMAGEVKAFFLCTKLGGPPEARDEAIQTPVSDQGTAIRVCKVQHIGMRRAHEKSRAEWLRGLRRKTESPHLRCPLDAGIAEIGPDLIIWEVYELLAYRSLRDCLFDPEVRLPPSEELLWMIAAQTAEGARALHASDHVHRDIKSANLFVIQLEPELRLAVGDFETALRMGSTACDGAKNWNLPKGDAVTPQIDVWSLGVTLLEASIYRNCTNPGELTEAEELIEGDEFSGTGMRRFFPEIGKLPERLRNLVFHLLSDKPSMRPSMEQVMGWRAQIEPGQVFNVHTLFPPIKYGEEMEREAHGFRESGSLSAHEYPQDFVRDFLRGNSGTSADFFGQMDNSPDLVWVAAQCGNSGINEGYTFLRKLYGAADTPPKMKGWAFYKACFLIDPACPLPWREFHNGIHGLSDLKQWLAGSIMGREESFRGLAALLEPNLESEKRETVSLLEVWLKATQVKRFYWDDLIAGSRAFASRVMEALRVLLAKVNARKGPLPEDFPVLRLTALHLALREDHGGGGGPPLLEIIYGTGMIPWKRPAEDWRECEIRDPADLARFFLTHPEEGDQLRRMGVAGLWLDVCSVAAITSPREISLGSESAFHDHRPDALLTLLLAWELCMRMKVDMTEGGEWAEMLVRALKRVMAEPGKVPWELWSRDEEHRLRKLAGNCMGNSSPQLILNRLLKLRSEVRKKYDAVTDRRVPLSRGRDLPVGALMISMAFSGTTALYTDTALEGALTLLDPEAEAEAKSAVWWSGLSRRHEVGRWMLARGNEELADKVRRSAALSIWLLAHEVLPGWEPAISYQGMEALEPGWIIDLADPQLTTRLGVLLAGMGRNAGPVAELVWVRNGVEAGSFLLNEGCHHTPLYFDGMKTGQGTRLESFILRNAEGVLPGVLCSEVGIRDSGSIFGDPVGMGERRKFTARKVFRELGARNEAGFSIPLNTSEGRISGFEETVILEVRYNFRGATHWRTFEIPLKCAVTVNHGAILSLGLRATALGMLIFGGMGWCLHRIVAESSVEERGAEGQLLAGKVESGAQHWWRRWEERPEENLLPWGGAMEPVSDPVPLYFEQVIWGLGFITLVLLSLLVAFFPKFRKQRFRE